MRVKAVLFDMDGVLCDSEPIHVEAYREMFKLHGVILNKKDTADIFGKLDEHIIADICKKRRLHCDVYAMGREKRELIPPLLRKLPMPIYAHVKTFVAFAKKHAKIGLATSSSRKEFKITLQRIGLQNAFKATLGKEDVRTHKPSPEIYRKLAKKLHVRPNECIVIEDSVTGVEAAKRAGMFCVAVLNSFPAVKLKKADMIVKNLNDIRLRRLLVANL